MEVFYVREWLNQPGKRGASYVLAQIETDEDLRHVWATVQIADCSEHIVLEFDADGRDDYFLNDLQKLELLITTLTNFRDEFIAARRRFIATERDRNDERQPPHVSFGTGLPIAEA